jgi:hypothetical protein
MIPIHRANAAVLIALFAFVACEGTEAAPPAAFRLERPGDLAERVHREVSWEPVFRIGGLVDDTLLAQPMRPAADASGAYLLDGYMKRVLRFDSSGAFLWSYGREGGGPGEFRQPRDLKVDAEGRAWVLDAPNGRITVLRPDGTQAFEVSLRRAEWTPDRLVPQPDGGVLLVSGSPLVRIIRMNRDGVVLSAASLPIDRADELHGLAAQVVPRGDPVTGRWSAAFMVADGLFSFDGLRPRHPHAWFVEEIPWPSLRSQRSGNTTTTRMERPVFAASSIAVDGDRVLVHFHGRSELRSRLIDIYSAEDGRYIESVTLPRVVEEIDFRDGVLYGVYSEPFPGFEAWRTDLR